MADAARFAAVNEMVPRLPDRRARDVSKGGRDDVHRVSAFLRSESGASAAEYAMILAVIGAALGLAIFTLASAIGTSVNARAACLANTQTC